jgi:hypothetical protein
VIPVEAAMVFITAALRHKLDLDRAFSSALRTRIGG